MIRDIRSNRRRFMAYVAAIGGAAVLGAGFALAASEQEAKDMVAKAIALYDEKGDAALAIFNEGKASGFAAGEVYIVVQSTGADAKVLAHAADPKLVGTPLQDIADPTGKKFGVEMSEKATEEGGWFDYDWPNPATGKVQKKKAWAVLHKGLVFISGIYV
jgi:cytochrome c